MTTATAATLPIRLSAPGDILAAAPYLLGYHPSDSIVFLALSGGDVKVTGRYDLSGHDGSRDPTRLVRALKRQGVDSVLLIGYGPAARVTADMDLARTTFAAHGVPVRDALRVTDGRYWSYFCTGPCCPMEGTAFDLSVERVSAAMTYAGLQALPDRGHLAASLRSPDEVARTRIRRKTGRAADRLKRALLGSPDTSECWDRWRDEGVRHLHRVIAAVRADGVLPTEDDLAELLVFVTHARIRDEAWAMVDDHPAQELIPLWTYAVRHADEDHVATPAVLLGYAAWRTGNGALARLAVERALAADPEYRLGLMLLDVLDAGIPPAELPPVTREWIAATYEEDDAGAGDGGEPEEPDENEPRAPEAGAESATEAAAATEPAPEPESGPIADLGPEAETKSAITIDSKEEPHVEAAKRHAA